MRGRWLPLLRAFRGQRSLSRPPSARAGAGKQLPWLLPRVCDLVKSRGLPEPQVSSVKDGRASCPCPTASTSLANEGVLGVAAGGVRACL